MHGVELAARKAGVRAAIVLSALALLLRILVPAGFMPSTDARAGFAITLCSDMSGITGWVDQDGKLHKGQKSSPDGTSKHQPCVFSGFAAALTLPDFIVPAGIAPLAAAGIFTAFPGHFAIGQGLAAPPPPPTGPPAHR
jgi:hypothetical protein